MADDGTGCYSTGVSDFLFAFAFIVLTATERASLSDPRGRSGLFGFRFLCTVLLAPGPATVRSGPRPSACRMFVRTPSLCEISYTQCRCRRVRKHKRCARSMQTRTHMHTHCSDCFLGRQWPQTSSTKDCACALRATQLSVPRRQKKNRRCALWCGARRFYLGLSGIPFLEAFLGLDKTH